ncbi:MAG: 6-phosphofructokinase, partial [Oscillospiraceae bacterium]|nr:6-phosphofructokinase [Oscillospiraceae bacterium]
CSKTDIDEAERIGRHALRAALDGNTGKMMYFRRVSDVPYAVTIEMTDASKVANLEKKFPTKWISSDNNQVTDAAISYFLPLIQGEVDIMMRNGMPVHFQRPLQMR